MANPLGANDEDVAAQKILSMIAPEEAQPEEEAEQEEVTEEVAEEATEETEESTEESEEKSEDIELDPDEKLFEVEETVEGGGKETRKYSLNELKAQRMMQADYQRKTAELARQREQAQEEIRQGIEESRKQYQQSLEMQQKLVWGLVAPELQKTDLEKLAEEDPAEYIKAQNRINKFQQVIQGIQAEQQKLAQQEIEHLQRVVIPKASEELQRDIPNWGPELKQNLMKTGETYGFRPEELQAVVDPRVIKVLHDAWRFRQIGEKKPIADKKVVEKPRVMKPGTKQKQEPSKDEFKRLQKTGKLEDAAAAIFKML